ncbi:MAG: hypothetical protein PSV16_00505 [Flavobacterium sp.]|nr:hypothetical protein [Flavobacterium sp.]
MKDIEAMLDSTIQEYYSKQYLTHQKKVIEDNEKFSEDILMAENFISESNISGNLVEIGSGNCRWFPHFEHRLNHYYGIDVNGVALSVAPKHPKLTTIEGNVFEDEIQLFQSCSLNVAFFSFFLSHFSNRSIQILMEKLSAIKTIIIIDSFWGEKHKEKHLNKDLIVIKRKTSQSDYIHLPKRFFERDDISDIFRSFGFSIDRFEQGQYWFICIMKRD